MVFDNVKLLHITYLNETSRLSNQNVTTNNWKIKSQVS